MNKTILCTICCDSTTKERSGFKCNQLFSVTACVKMQNAEIPRIKIL